ncbi:MAG: HEAT repeat domain-containing protein [Planctomycetaceae bacterium]|nr:HEAT repeat domain-containing protein [Planctomycetaceae bacterium]
MPWKAKYRVFCLGLGILCGSTTLYGQNAAPVPVDSPLSTQPETADGHFEAALLMLRLARPELAKFHLEKMLEAAPEDALLLQLRDEHGSGTFLELAGRDDLNPPAAELLNLLNDAVRKRISSPGYADSLLQKLEGSSRERSEAITELRHLGSPAVPPLLRALDGQLGVSRETLTVALARLGSDAIPPLIGALKSSDETVRAVAAEVLGLVGAKEDAIWLWHPAFSETELPGVQQVARRAIARLQYGDKALTTIVSDYGAANRLLSTATSYLNGTYKWSDLLDENKPFSVWTWDDGRATVAEYPVSRQRAANYFAERLAREASSLSPALEDATNVQLAALLERDVDEAGWDQPIPFGPQTALQYTVESGPDVSSNVLRFALDNGLVAAQLGAVQALALNGSSDLLRQPFGKSPILDALNSPHPRVQFAAATTILQWEPRSPFRNSSRVVEILARALNSEARAAGVVFDPNISRGTVTAGIFGELGFDPLLAATGMDGFRLAARRGNVELAVLHPNVVRWELSQTIDNLRADARTAEIPVVIYGPAQGRQHYESLASKYRKVVFVQQATSSADVNRELRPALAQFSPPPLTAEQRGERAQEAAFWLRRIATSQVPGVFDLAGAEESLAAAINRPEVAADALIALGGVGRPSVQELYARMATAPAASSQFRELAALQLAYHIQRYGKLIHQDDADALRATFAAESDPAVRTAIGSVVGAMKPDYQIVRERMLAVPLSPAPVSDATSQPVPQ